MVMAAYRLFERQLQVLRLMRDSRPFHITPRDCSTTFPTIRHLGRMGLVEYTGGPGMWRATITSDGITALNREHARQRNAS